MSGMCKANARQSSRDKNYWAGKEKCSSWEIAKNQPAKRQKRIREAFIARQAARVAARKPTRGSARRARRMALNATAHAA